MNTKYLKQLTSEIPEYLYLKIRAWAQFTQKINIAVFSDNNIHIENAFLLEATKYNEKYYVIYLDRDGSNIILNNNFNNSETYSIEDITLSLISTSDNTYQKLLDCSYEHYEKFINNFSIAYYGNASNLKGFHSYYDKFNMSQARNRSLSRCKSKLTLQIDTGILLSKEQIYTLIQKLNNSSILQLKQTHKSGNGNYFGSTKSMFMNNYNEDFKDYWFEDTEYLLNFSRVGIIPEVVIINYFEVSHKKLSQGEPWDTNFLKFKEVLYNGRQNAII